MRDNSRRHRRPRRPGGNGGPPQGGGQGAAQPNQQARAPQGPGNSSEQRNQSFRRSRRRRSGRPLSPAQVVQKYLNLLEQHLTNRRKYYEFFNREDGRHRRRLEKNFFNTIEQLRRFEEKLDGRQREALQAHVERYRLDLTYSSNHQISPIPEPVERTGDFADPHFTPVQAEAFKLWADDKEESVGTIDDYLAYKASK